MTPLGEGSGRGFSCALFTALGDLLAQADHMPAQLGGHVPGRVKSTLDRWRDSIVPGDVFAANHPYMGCMHTPDINILLPVFIADELFAWSGANRAR
jgi:N-methylhydantoinase B